MSKQITQICVSFITLFLISACSSRERAEIRVGAVSTVPVAMTTASLNRFLDVLNNNNQNYNFISDVTRSYALAIEKSCNNQWDLVFAFSPLVAARVLDKCNMELIYPAFIYRHIEETTYYSGLFVKNDSDILSLEDINNHSLALNQIYSASGFVIPLYLLRDTQLSNVEILGSYEEIERQVFLGEFDIGVIPMNTENIVSQNFPEGTFRIIALSPPIPSAGLLISTSLDIRTNQEITSLLETHNDSAYGSETKDGLFWLYDANATLPDYSSLIEVSNYIDPVIFCLENTSNTLNQCRDELP